jgi:hypothetical protein
MKKDLLKKLKYDMPKDEKEPMMEIELGMEEEEEGEEPEMISLDMEEEAGMEGPDLSGFSDEELQAELDRRKKPEMPEEEMA